MYIFNDQCNVNYEYFVEIAEHNSTAINAHIAG